KDDIGKEGAAEIIEIWRRHVAHIRHLYAVCGFPLDLAENPGGLIVLDTYARAVAGSDEDDAGQAMAFLENRAGYIARETGCAVMILHHPNAAGNPRGSTAVKAALDLMLRA